MGIGKGLKRIATGLFYTALWLASIIIGAVILAGLEEAVAPGYIAAGVLVGLIWWTVLADQREAEAAAVRLEKRLEAEREAERRKGDDSREPFRGARTADIKLLLDTLNTLGAFQRMAERDEVEILSDEQIGNLANMCASRFWWTEIWFQPHNTPEPRRKRVIAALAGELEMQARESPLAFFRDYTLQMIDDNAWQLRKDVVEQALPGGPYVPADLEE